MCFSFSLKKVYLLLSRTSLSNNIQLKKQKKTFICLAKDLFVVKSFDNEKIISQIVGIGKWCDQNGDRVCMYAIVLWLVNNNQQSMPMNRPRLVSMYVFYQGLLSTDTFIIERFTKNMGLCLHIIWLPATRPDYQSHNKINWVRKNINKKLCSKIYRDKISAYDKHPRAGHNTQHFNIKSRLIK